MNLVGVKTKIKRSDLYAGVIFRYSGEEYMVVDAALNIVSHMKPYQTLKNPLFAMHIKTNTVSTFAFDSTDLDLSGYTILGTAGDLTLVKN